MVLIADASSASSAWPTTAGSRALLANVSGVDAPVVARLRGAGMVILGKTNLSEWANIRSSNSISGWSAVGGQTRNPFALDRDPCGSSSGSGAAVGAAAVGAYAYWDTLQVAKTARRLLADPALDAPPPPRER